MALNIFNDHSLTCPEVLANQASLQTIQGYSLVSHGRRNVWLGLARFQAPDERKPELRKFLKAFGSSATSAFDLWTGLRQYAAARDQAADAAELVRLRSEFNRPIVTALGLSASGYALFPQAVVPRFAAFRGGFRSRFRQLPVEGFGDPFDAVLILAADDPVDRLDTLRADMMAKLEGLASVQWELGRVEKQNGTTHEPFGFVDGISQPAFFASDDDPHAKYWKPFAPLALLLTREPESAVTDDEFGSLMAFMKIDQDLNAFDRLIQEMVDSSKSSPQDVRSWLVGRQPDGTPLMPTGAGNNDFLYDSDPNFQICPASAHIRKANPRTQDAVGVRIVRRGVPYGRDGEPRGLLFQGFTATLEHTFEVIMNTWLLNAQFPRGAMAPGMDPILGARAQSPLPAGVTNRCCPTVQSITTVATGEYFYFPSIPLFGRLEQ